MSKNEGSSHSLDGLKHEGTVAFGNRTLKRRKKAKTSRKARRKNRKK